MLEDGQMASPFYVPERGWGQIIENKGWIVPTSVNGGPVLEADVVP